MGKETSVEGNEGQAEPTRKPCDLLGSLEILPPGMIGEKGDGQGDLPGGKFQVCRECLEMAAKKGASSPRQH